MATISKTLSVQIARPADDAYRFVADAANMPRWAFHNVKSIRQLEPNQWAIETPRGPGKLVLHFDQRFRILDHDFVDPREGAWAAAARIVPAGANDCVYMITLVKPPAMPEEAFHQGLRLVEEELQRLKAILEKQ
jgi:hypothetical protein